MSDVRPELIAAAPFVETIYVREPHETQARAVGAKARAYTVIGAKATARGAVVTGHVVRGFFAGLFKG